MSPDVPTGRDELMRSWQRAPTRSTAEALARLEGGRLEQGHPLDAWLDALSAPHDAPGAAPRGQAEAALLAFGVAALPGLCERARQRSQTAATLLARIAPEAPFVGRALLDLPYEGDGRYLGPSPSDDALLACVRAGGLARADLTLPPGVRHKHGPKNARLARLLARLGPGYVDEMRCFLERTVSLSHQKLVDELGQVYPHDPPDEFLPIVEAILRQNEGFGPAEAAWFAVRYRARAAPLCDALVATLRAGTQEARRGAATALAYIQAPAERALAPLVALIDKALTGQRLPLLELDPVAEAIGSLQPPPADQAPLLETLMLRALREEHLSLADTCAMALARVQPERVLALLGGVAQADDAKAARYVVALIRTPAVGDPLRLAWLTRLLKSPRVWPWALPLAGEPRFGQLVPLLVERLASLREPSMALTKALARHDPSLVLPELEPLMASPDASRRRPALEVVLAMGHTGAVARFATDDDVALVRRAASWLAAQGDAGCLPQLALLAGHRKRTMRRLALRGLGRLGAPAPLEAALSDRSPRVRRLARALRGELDVRERTPAAK